MVHQISLFISHSWSYPGHYETLAEWVFDRRWEAGGVPIIFTDRSIPKNDPIHNAANDQQLQDAIFRRIYLSDIVIIPTGMYASYSYWIQKEIDGAREFYVPILAVNPWGQERKSSVVSEAAVETVGWNCQSVLNAICKIRRILP